MSQPAPHTGRRADLDWIRIAALALLILYHVSLAYTPWDWHLNSSHRFVWMEEVTLLSSPWRLTLLFFVSGAALRLMSRRLVAGQVLKARFARLAPPFLFGVLFLIPPQSWAEAFGKGSFSGNMGEWWLKEFSPAGIADGIPINHLWFVLYIGVYSLAAIALLARPGLLARIEAFLDRILGGWRVLLLPILYLAIVRQLLFPWFGLTNRLPVDWYNHASSLAVFLLGFALVGREGFWRQLERVRWVAAAAALTSVVLLMGLHLHPEGRMLWGSLRNGAFAITQWSTVAAVLGFGSLYLRSADGPVCRYLNEAIFPCYLAHQTILVLAVFFLGPLKLPALPEALLFIALTFGGSLLVYEAVRRIEFIRPLWGLKPSPGAGKDNGRPNRLSMTVASALGPERAYRRRRALLVIGMASPVLAILSVLTAVAAYPGFNHATQFLSELGGATARAPGIFNGGVMISGIAAAVAGIGFGLAAVTLGGSRIASALLTLCFVLAGIGLVISGLYVWPDPRHLWVNLGLGIILAPLFLIWCLSPVTGVRRLKLFLVAVCFAMAALALITNHMVLPGTVNPANVGLWERLFAIVLVSWTGIAAYCLERALFRLADSNGAGKQSLAEA
ncbi:MAG: acyltransferase family protein [Caulobacter sp.]|nr:acyltransferase family protein [Caulobacter sp.]